MLVCIGVVRITPFVLEEHHMSFLSGDVLHAIRALRHQRGVTLLGITIIALTVGLNTAVFSIVDGVVLRPIDARDPDKLVALCETDRGEPVDWCGASVPDIYDVGARSPSIAVAGAAREWPFVLRTPQGSDGINGGLATPEAFDALGIVAARGRLIERQDLGTSWRRVVVLTDRSWRTRFGGRPDLIGQTITLDDEPHVVIGILSPTATVPLLERVEMWRPIHFDPRDETRRDWRGFLAFVRLRPDAPLDRARTEITAIATGIQQAHFPEKPGWTIHVRGWQDVIVGSVRRTMYIFLASAGLVLLVGCANVASLLLAQGAARQRDSAVRAALGASRRRLLQAQLIESLLLATVGGTAAIALGWAGIRVFVALAPGGIPRIDEVALDLRVLAFTGGLVLLTTILVGVPPAARATRLDLQRVLAEAGRTGTRGRLTQVGNALVVFELALAVTLAAAGGLLARSFATLASWEPGFEQRHLVTAWALASSGRFGSREEIVNLWTRAEEELRALPSVISVGTASAGPLFGGDGESHFSLDGLPVPTSGARQSAAWFDVGPGYFRTLGIPIVRGRDVAATDRLGTPLVAVVNESFAHRYLSGVDPIGHTVHMAEHDADFRLVGVVRDIPPLRPGDPVPPQIFWSNRQVPRPATYFLVRTAGDPRIVAAVLSDRLKSVAEDLQVSQVRTMRDWLAQRLVRPRFSMVLMTAFGALALVLAAVGTYGVLAHSVSQRTKEIGIRMALGARPGEVVAGVLRQGMVLASVAVVLGALGALLLGRSVAALLAGVTPTDPLSFGVSAGVVLVSAAVACWVPARRASRVDPLVSLRME